jgi:serine/threonine protein kinase
MAGFFERLLESVGIKPAQTVQEYTTSLVEVGASFADFEAMSLEELASVYGFKKLHVNRVEAHRAASSAPGAGGASQRERPSEGMTPRSARWDSVLKSEGPERRAALQEVLDGWHEGRWVIEELELGRGSGGAVFQSSDSDLGLLAIKFSVSDEPRSLQREVRLLRRVAHDRICRIYEHHVSADDGRLFGMVLELLEAGDLAQRIKDNDGRIREFEVIQMAFDVLSALSFMHKNNVIHRDIKPSNIMLTYVDGRIVFKLIDLSIAAVEADARAEVSHTLATGTASLAALAGTAHYMSPEQIQESVVVTSQTDLWSLGVVMFECLSGVLPFAPKEKDTFKICNAIMNKEAPELSDVIEEIGTVSEGMGALVQQALQKGLSRRFGTATEMTAALDERLTMAGDEIFSLFISYRVWCDELFAEALFTAASKCQLRPGREHRMKVYLDKVCIVDGQRFDVNFAKGLANSTVFSPLVSANCLKNFVELGHTDKEDFVLVEWIMALELQKQGIVKAIFPIVMGEQNSDGKFSQTFFEGLRDNRVSWPASDGFYAGGSGVIPDVVSAKSTTKAREFLGMLTPPVPLSEEMTVSAVVKKILTFQAVLLHFENDQIDSLDAMQLVRVNSTHGKRAKEIARKHVAQTCAERIAKVVSEHEHEHER